MLLPVAVVLILIIFAIAMIAGRRRPDHNMVPTTAARPQPRATQAPAFVEPPPPRFSTGFGQPLRPLNDKPEKLKTWAPSMESYYQPARECVPVDFPVVRLEDCPPVRPMSSALPMANLPMCALRA